MTPSHITRASAQLDAKRADSHSYERQNAPTRGSMTTDRVQA